MVGRHRPPDELRLAQLTARVDQALALVSDAMRAHGGDRTLVDLCLDVINALRETGGTHDA